MDRALVCTKDAVFVIPEEDSSVGRMARLHLQNTQRLLDWERRTPEYERKIKSLEDRFGYLGPFPLGHNLYSSGPNKRVKSSDAPNECMSIVTSSGTPQAHEAMAIVTSSAANNHTPVDAEMHEAGGLVGSPNMYSPICSVPSLTPMRSNGEDYHGHEVMDRSGNNAVTDNECADPDDGCIDTEDNSEDPAVEFLNDSDDPEGTPTPYAPNVNTKFLSKEQKDHIRAIATSDLSTKLGIFVLQLTGRTFKGRLDVPRPIHFIKHFPEQSLEVEIKIKVLGGKEFEGRVCINNSSGKLYIGNGDWKKLAVDCCLDVGDFLIGSVMKKNKSFEVIICRAKDIEKIRQ